MDMICFITVEHNGILIYHHCTFVRCEDIYSLPYHHDSLLFFSSSWYLWKFSDAFCILHLMGKYSILLKISWKQTIHQSSAKIIIFLGKFASSWKLCTWCVDLNISEMNEFNRTVPLGNKISIYSKCPSPAMVSNNRTASNSISVDRSCQWKTTLMP